MLEPVSKLEASMKIVSGVCVIVLFVLACPGYAPAQQFSEAIEDNSYFIEEAYNQEPRVVQHISNGVYTSGPEEAFAYTFTQEWPVFSQKHQFSYSIPAVFLMDTNESGFGDIYLNYRYQLLGPDAAVTMAPRLSLILPTGNEDLGLGSGATGFEFNLPASKRLSDPWIVHFNAGFKVFADVQDQTLSSFHAGGSVIWLTRPNFNLMLEYLWLAEAELSETGQVLRPAANILNPGFRYAANVGSLQIVPGFAVPITFVNGETNAGVFLYLSFEHPF